MKRLYKFVLPFNYKHARSIWYTCFRKISRLPENEMYGRKHMMYWRIIQKLDKYLLTYYKTLFENDKSIRRYLPKNRKFTRGNRITRH